MSEIVIDVLPGKYVVAVSGGVDSVVLLDLLAKDRNLELIVAHFDHGIRTDSAEDRKFVERLAGQYGLQFEYAEGGLGPEASEEVARNARYSFLGQVLDEHNARAIVTAHHQDDLIETAIINLIRGTRRKGLSSLKSTPTLIRPMLHISRQTIEEYANKHGLAWREDSTNQDTRYLRNYVRLEIVPALTKQDPKWRKRLLNKIKKNEQIERQISAAINRLADQNIKVDKNRVTIPRHWLIMLPNSVGLEVMKYAVDLLQAETDVRQQVLKSLLLFAKTAAAGKRRPLGKAAVMLVSRTTITLSAKA